MNWVINIRVSDLSSVQCQPFCTVFNEALICHDQWQQCHITNASQPSYGGCNICGSRMKSASQPITGCPTGLNEVKGVLQGSACHSPPDLTDWPTCSWTDSVLLTGSNLHVMILPSVYNMRMGYSKQTISATGQIGCSTLICCSVVTVCLSVG